MEHTIPLQSTPDRTETGTPGEDSSSSLPSLHDYQAAIDVQSACNLSGVIFSFARTMQRICNEAHLHSHGTDWKNKHPICRLYAEQITFLTGGGCCTDNKNYAEAYTEIEKKIDELKTHAPTTPTSHTPA